jgi:hypothetical protein
VSGYYRESDGKHICDCGAETVYQSLSGGREYYCENCENQGLYPEGEGGPRARILTQPGGADIIRAQMDKYFAEQKEDRD